MAVKKTVKKQVSDKKTVKKPTAKKVTAKKPEKKKTAVKKPTEKKSTGKKSTVSKHAAKKAAVKKPAIKKTASKKAVVKKPAAKKTTASKKVAVKKPAVKKAAVKKTASKKPAEKKSTVKKPVVKKTAAAKKTTVKKPAVKKTITAKKTTVKKPEVKKAVSKKAEVKKADGKKSSEWVSVDEFRDGLNFKNTTLAAKGASIQKKQSSRAQEKAEGVLTDKDIARLYLKQEKYAELESLCKFMINKKETDDTPFWHETLSDVYGYFGKWQEAIDVNKKRTAAYPNDWSSWNTLASVYAVLGDYKNAADTLKKAEGKINWDIPYDEPDMEKEPPMYEEFFAYSKEGDPSSFSGVFWPKNAMFTLYPKILEKTPKSVFGWYSLAKFYGDNLHYFSEAAKAIENAVKIKPDWKPALAYHAQMLSFAYKTNIDDGYFKETDQKEKEKKQKQELGVKAKEAYDKWKNAKAG